MAEAVINEKIKQEEIFPPVFWSELTESDKNVLLANSSSRKFDTDFVYEVARRCKHGFAQVLVCRPFMSEGTPFPTLFWLVCPFLDRRCAELEAEHKIPELERELEKYAEDVKQWHKEYATLRKKLTETADLSHIKNLEAILKSFEKYGVGGINREKPCTAKCLHLQTATMLGWKHPLRDWLLSELGETECKCGDCKKCVLHHLPGSND